MPTTPTTPLAAAPARTFPSPAVRRPAAFELIATNEGALLLWAAGRCADGLAWQRLDADGAPLGQSGKIATCESGSPLASAEISEVSAVAGGGRMGALWRVESAGDARVAGTFGPDDASSFAPVLQLGAANPEPSEERGGLWLSGASNGQMRALFRARASSCGTAGGSCAQLLTSAFPPREPNDAAAPRRPDAREIPHPCSQLIVGSLWNQGIWYDAFCALDSSEGAPTTEVYSIRPEIFYAEASPVLQGCSARGVAPSGSGILIFGACNDGLRVHSLHASRRETIVAAQRTLQCEAGRPTLTIRGEHGQSEAYSLAGPRDRLELWLPDDMAPAGSRVVFTGRRLLVATRQGSRLGLRSYRCDGETVVSEAATML